MISSGEITAWILVAAASGITTYLFARSYNKKHKSKIRVALSYYPDSVPLLYAAARGYLHPDRYEIFLVEWTTAYQLLKERRFEVLLGNQSLSRELDGRDFDSYADLIFYDAFALIGKSNGPLESWGHITRNTPDLSMLPSHVAQMRRLDMLFTQLGGRQIYTTSADTLQTLVQILERCNITYRKRNIADQQLMDEAMETHITTIIVGLDPVSALKHFLNAPADSLFVGGVLERLYARRRGCKILFDCNEARGVFQAGERNGFVAFKVAHEAIPDLEAVWFQAVQEISSSPDAREYCVELINRYIVSQRMPDYPFGIDDFNAFWNILEVFSTSTSNALTEARRVAGRSRGPKWLDHMAGGQGLRDIEALLPARHGAPPEKRQDTTVRQIRSPRG